MKKQVQLIAYNTIDLDTNEKETVNRIIEKIINCNDLIEIEISDSLQKGKHLILWCITNCEKCRLVFDDSVRYAYDQYRIKSSQDVLFDEKEFF